MTAINLDVTDVVATTQKKSALQVLKQDAPAVWEMLRAFEALGAEPRLTYLQVGGVVIRDSAAPTPHEVGSTRIGEPVSRPDPYFGDRTVGALHVGIARNMN